jgi:hypothetical protein
MAVASPKVKPLPRYGKALVSSFMVMANDMLSAVNKMMHSFRINSQRCPLFSTSALAWELSAF